MAEQDIEDTYEANLLAEIRNANKIALHNSELLLGIFVQLTRLYDVALVTAQSEAALPSSVARYKALAEMHEKGGTLSSYPTLSEDAFDEPDTTG